MSFEASARVICEDIAEIAEPSSPAHAALAQALAIAADKGVADAARLYDTLDWWGGSGSMADLIVEGREPAYCQRLVDLVDLFEAHGVRSQRARQWAETFRQWLKDDIWARIRRAHP